MLDGPGRSVFEDVGHIPSSGQAVSRNDTHVTEPADMPSPPPHVEPWPSTVRATVLVLSILAAWAVLAAIGAMIVRATQWTRG